MRTPLYLALALSTLSASIFAAPLPQLNNVLGSVTNPSAGNNNVFEGNGNHDGNGNGEGNGNGNVVGVSYPPTYYTTFLLPYPTLTNLFQ